MRRRGEIPRTDKAHGTSEEIPPKSTAGHIFGPYRTYAYNLKIETRGILPDFRNLNTTPKRTFWTV